MIKIKTNPITKKHWLVNENGTRLTRKFSHYCIDRRGPFEVIVTDLGKITYVYRRHSSNILLDSSQLDNCMRLTCEEITDKIYSIESQLYKDRHYCYRTYIYDENGNLITSEYDQVRKRSEELMAVCKDNKWGLVNNKFETIVAPIWYDIYPFNSYGYAGVVFRETGKMSLIDTKGNYVISPKDCTICDFLSEKHFAFIGNETNLRGVMDLGGNIIIQDWYDNIVANGNYIIVYKAEKKGMFNFQGEKILDCIYPEIIETYDKFVVHDFAKTEIPKLISIPK